MQNTIMFVERTLQVLHVLFESKPAEINEKINCVKIRVKTGRCFGQYFSISPVF